MNPFSPAPDLKGVRYPTTTTWRSFDFIKRLLFVLTYLVLLTALNVFDGVPDVVLVPILLLVNLGLAAAFFSNDFVRLSLTGQRFAITQRNEHRTYDLTHLQEMRVVSDVRLFSLPFLPALPLYRLSWTDADETEDGIILLVVSATKRRALEEWIGEARQQPDAARVRFVHE
jgi:hypothetical protein